MGAKSEQDSEEDNQAVAREDTTIDRPSASKAGKKHEPSGGRAGDEIREQMADAGKTLKRQLSEETGKLQQRLKQELGSAVKKGTKNQNLGHAPISGHPAAHRSAPPGPSQAPPGTRRRK